MLARHVEDAIGLYALQNFIRGIEFFGLRQLSDVSGVQHETWRLRQRVKAGDSLLKCSSDILVRFLVEADMAVADLSEEDALSLRLGQKFQRGRLKRNGNSAAQAPQRG